MKKAILISIRPEWVAKILNGEKTIEIRKNMPKCELPIDVYIYCSKGKSLRQCEFSSYEYANQSFKAFVAFPKEVPLGKERCFWVNRNSLEFDGDNTILVAVGEKVRQEIDYIESTCFEASPSVNGKVVAKFTLKRVEEFGIGNPYEEHTRALLNEACVTIAEARRYAGGKHPYYLCHNSLYAWHISDLEVFDEPKELSDFFSLPETYHHDHESMVEHYERKEARRLKRAPQSWSYIEVDE